MGFNGDQADTGWITLPSDVDDWGIQYRVRNGVCTVLVDGGYASTSGTDHTISNANLPAAYRPPANARVGGYFEGHPGVVSVHPGGSVAAIQQSGAGRSSVAAVLSYPVD
jgi:hypothetical protein